MPFHSKINKISQKQTISQLILQIINPKIIKNPRKLISKHLTINIHNKNTTIQSKQIQFHLLDPGNKNINTSNIKENDKNLNCKYYIRESDTE